MINGCHNHAPYKETLEVQDGWYTGLHGERLPRMVRIPAVMSKDCRYDSIKTDPGCVGCDHGKERADNGN